MSSNQQHNGHAVQAPPETGAVVPPHPQMYDITTDDMRPVAQEDYDAARRGHEEGALRAIMMRKLLNMELDGLRRLRKLWDHHFTGPPRAKS